MRTAVVGVGAVGGWFGGSLVRAGHDVVFIARGETLDVLRTEGLRLNDDPPIPVDAVGSLAEAGSVDVVLLAVKVTAATDLPALLDALPAGAHVAVTQNSVEVPSRVAAVVGWERTLPGVVRGYYHHTGPGRVEFHGGPVSYDVGGEEGVVGKLVAALNSAGVDATARDDIIVDVWEKAMYVTTTGALGALAQAPLGELRTRLRPTLEALMREVESTARANGVPLSDDVVERTLEFADRMPATATSSMHRDLLAGRPHELDSQVGAICRMAARQGVDVRLHDLLLGVLG
ncbi:MAG: 2-dehydropantoate 2-reductase [Corynebacterium humireducens]|jgi:2-dehydropantoate 2-reductase|uniref:2-dehydropantoate 2-reductase n=1 Tax=Corynebacterium humireducens TaxID=1223514 RepID=A0A7X6SWV3_9CORY|nr:2-dehydropantoate 2-reductase [Corynebacterium humireducens]